MALVDEVSTPETKQVTNLMFNSHLAVALWTRRGPRLQRLYLFKDQVDLPLCRFIGVVASADAGVAEKKGEFSAC